MEIDRNVYWVGILDFPERDFHNFTTHRGLTYNSYLILDEHVTVVDGVKHKYVKDQIRKIERYVDPKKIEYVVVNHIEPDHSSGLPELAKIANPTFVCTKKAKEGLEKYYNADWNFKIVRSGDELKIGENTLRFIETPMLHWPDSMMTYMVERRILFSMDAFGQHVASEERFDEDLGIEEAIYWAKVYYANIIMPYANIVLRIPKIFEKFGVNPKLIAPSHGVIWRNPDVITESYLKWAKFEAERKAFVIYDTMWHSTEKLAFAIADGISSTGVKTSVFNVRKDAWADIVTEILDAKAVCIGAPTMHNHVFPPMAGFLTYLKGLRPKNKIGTAFCSYGWGSGAYENIVEVMESLGWEIVEGLQVQFRPSEEELKRAFDLGVEIGKKVLEVV
ncbi:FprA family A-type flavoprotein [Archaeoglobus sp.]